MSDHLQNCHVDFLAFSIKPDDTENLDYMAAALGIVKTIFGPVTVEDTGRGWSGFGVRLDIHGIGLVAFGGNGGVIHFEITGEGCSQVADWNGLADLLDDCTTKITRVDIAHDDVEGETLSIEWARQQYQNGGFKPSRGLSPKARSVNDEGSGDGCTFYVGSRESGKMARIYEKGKQLGDRFSAWVRFEVEWRSVHRELPSDMLRDPSRFFSGAYRCCDFVGSRMETVRTVAFKAAASLEKATDHAIKQAGSVIAALKMLGHSASEIIGKLAKPEVSPRLLPNVIAIKFARADKKPDVAPAWWRPPTKEEAERTAASLRLDFSYWKAKWSSFQPQMIGV